MIDDPELRLWFEAFGSGPLIVGHADDVSMIPAKSGLANRLLIAMPPRDQPASDDPIIIDLAKGA